MLTIDEIKNVSFRKATRGYNADEVDSFIDEVIASFEQLKKEKTNLVHKIDRLATRLEEYRADEETVRNALLTSQKMSDACIREAKEKAARIIRDAEQKAKQITAEADRQTAAEKQNYIRLQADAVALRSELIELYGKHIKSLDDLPTKSDLEDTTSELNEKYPTEASYAPSAPAAPVRERVEEEDYRDEVEEEPVEKATPDDVRVAVKRPSRFSHLKFGDNYDVSAD